MFVVQQLGYFVLDMRFTQHRVALRGEEVATLHEPSHEEYSRVLVLLNSIAEIHYISTVPLYSYTTFS